MPKNKMQTILSTHFTLEEMLRSSKAEKNKIVEQYNPPADVIQHLQKLCTEALEPLRAKVSEQLKKDTPIIISSGYRCLRLNSMTPGAAGHSQHIKGEASDTHIVGMSIEEWYQFIKASGIRFDQLIQEFNLWAHISLSFDGHQRGECLRAITKNGHTTYESDGIVKWD